MSEICMQISDSSRVGRHAGAVSSTEEIARIWPERSHAAVISQLRIPSLTPSQIQHATPSPLHGNALPVLISSASFGPVRRVPRVSSSNARALNALAQVGMVRIPGSCWRQRECVNLHQCLNHTVCLPWRGRARVRLRVSEARNRLNAKVALLAVRRRIVLTVHRILPAPTPGAASGHARAIATATASAWIAISRSNPVDGCR